MSPLKSLVSEIATDIPTLVIDFEFAVFVINFWFPVFWGFWVFWVLYSIKVYFLVRFFMAIVLLWSLGLLSFSLCSSFLNEEIYTKWFQTFCTHAEKGLLSLHVTLIHMQLLPLLQPSLKEEALLLALLISVTQHLNITAAASQNPSVIANNSPAWQQSIHSLKLRWWEWVGSAFHGLSPTGPTTNVLLRLYPVSSSPLQADGFKLQQPASH